MLGTGELILIVLVILILFGPKQLPKMSKNLGKAIKDFKKGLDI